MAQLFAHHLLGQFHRAVRQGLGHAAFQLGKGGVKALHQRTELDRDLARVLGLEGLGGGIAIAVAILVAGLAGTAAKSSRGCGGGGGGGLGSALGGGALMGGRAVCWPPRLSGRQAWAPSNSSRGMKRP